jgi:hypothetical protein
MLWQKTIQRLEQNKQWDIAIIFMEQVINENSNDIDAYLSMNYLLMNLLVEEDYDENKHDYYESLIKKYFQESYAKFFNNPEYLFFTAITACMSEWYFGIKEEDIDKMIYKAIGLDPDNILYKWGFFIPLDKSDIANLNEMVFYTKKNLTNNFQIKNLLNLKGSLGKYLLNIISHISTRSLT